MHELSKAARQAALQVERHVDRGRRQAKARLGFQAPLSILPYRSYGTGQEAVVRARVVRAKHRLQLSQEASWYENLRYMLERYESDEVDHAHVRLRWLGQACETTADEEGYIHQWITYDLGADRADARTLAVELKLLDPSPAQPPLTTVVQVHVPRETARFGVISDIDDTIVRTGANSLLRHMRVVLLNNAATRVPFPGVAALYRGLQQGQGGEDNPFFYVSSSPWNIYDLLARYLELQGIPEGPIILRDMGLTADKWFKGTHSAHKLQAIRAILDTYPRLPFLLVGDSGQRDGGIYERLVGEYPNRILAVWLRDVTDARGDEAAREILSRVQQQGVATAYGEHLVEAADQALAKGWLTEEAHGAVRRAVAAHAGPSQPGQAGG